MVYFHIAKGGLQMTVEKLKQMEIFNHSITEEHAINLF